MGFGGEGQKEGTPKREGGKKEKREQTHDIERKRTRGTQRENGKNEKGEAYYSQTDGPLNSRRFPLGTRRDDSLHLRVSGAERGGSPLA